MEFFAKKENGTIVLPAIQNHLMNNFIKSIKDGKDVIYSIKVAHKPKSNKQIKAYWGLAMRHACAELSDRGWDTSTLLNTNKPTGIEIGPELLYEFLCNVCPVFNESGKRLTLSKMDTKQAAEFFDNCRNYMASQWSIAIPEPNPNWRRDTENE